MTGVDHTEDQAPSPSSDRELRTRDWEYRAPAGIEDLWREKPMGVLETATPIVVVCTRDRGRATAFYRDTPSLTFIAENRFAPVFDVGGTALHLSAVADFTLHEHTILGFRFRT